MMNEIELLLESGGSIVLIISILTFLMWILFIERMLFFSMKEKEFCSCFIYRWRKLQKIDSIPHSDEALILIKQRLIAEFNQGVSWNKKLIDCLVNMAPMLGLLGTTWGMMEVFNIISITDGGDIRQISEGVSKTIIPTLCGMTVSISGLLMSALLKKRIETSILRFNKALT